MPSLSFKERANRGDVVGGFLFGFAQYRITETTCGGAIYLHRVISGVALDMYNADLQAVSTIVAYLHKMYRKASYSILHHFGVTTPITHITATQAIHHPHLCCHFKPSVRVTLRAIPAPSQTGHPNSATQTATGNLRCRIFQLPQPSNNSFPVVRPHPRNKDPMSADSAGQTPRPRKLLTIPTATQPVRSLAETHT
jgi:hypothetical protein